MGTNAQHTPGPWAFDPETGEVFYDDSEGAKVRPVLATVNQDNIDTNSTQYRGDGALIAAASELLAALQCALFDLEHTYSHVSSVSADRIKSETIPLCRAAIAKATT